MKPKIIDQFHQVILDNLKNSVHRQAVGGVTQHDSTLICGQKDRSWILAFSE